MTRQRVQLWALFTISNYLVVLLLGACFHDHGPWRCMASHASSASCAAADDRADDPADDHSDDHAGEPADTCAAAAGSKACVHHYGGCLMCRFLGQKATALAVEVQGTSIPLRQLDVVPAVRCSPPCFAQPIIRGPPSLT